jgi:bifunctional non-homologous end joining protein LigD
MKEIAHITLSHPDKLYYPEANISKQDLAEYYHQNSKLILPHFINRPLSVYRCPEGVDHSCFFQKHIETLPDAVSSVHIKENHTNGKYIVAKDESSVIALVQNGSLEFHTWGSKADNIEHPDRVVFDLDPSPQSTFAEIVECAKIIRAGLEALDLKCFVKTSGKSGLHIFSPITPKHTWAVVKKFSLMMAKQIEKIAPEQYTSTVSKKKRQGKIYVDYLRNERGATCVAPHSTRATSNASVSVPVSWDELNTLKSADHYTVLNIGRRFSQLKKDPWHDYHKIKQSIPRAAS